MHFTLSFVEIADKNITILIFSSPSCFLLPLQIVHTLPVHHVGLQTQFTLPVCGLLMPASSREAYFALRAFNVEIASIKDASRLMGGRSRGTGSSSTASGILFDDGERNEAGTDSSLGSRLRMQWWRDAITGIYDSMDSSRSGLQQQQSSSSSDPLLNSLVASRKHNPTLRSLEQAIRTHGLTHTFLRRLMEAREVDLDVVQYERVRDIAQYGEDTVSNVLYLSLECAGVSSIQSTISYLFLLFEKVETSSLPTS